SQSDRTVINIAGLLTPFMVLNKVSEETLAKVQTSVDKNTLNIRKIAYYNEKLEQYTRRDNLRLFNFPLCDDSQLRGKFIELAALLGVHLQPYDINIIHRLSANERSQAVIVRFNNRKLRNDLLYAKKAPLNVPGSCFKGVFIQEDLTPQRSKLFKFLKNHQNTDKIQTNDGRLRVILKEDRGAGVRVALDNPDDLFKVGIDSFDITQFGFIDM
ncbi:MAG: hypothetical protein JAZ03_10310, partial [Candidatus Thiodiazotropha taylori]|nr:hypothetical protein [Candidatus Thiodiazotropha taylori]MCW4334319.1 hypothetical protein [Candidatus Thiodiazotropha endolucinida]